MRTLAAAAALMVAVGGRGDLLLLGALLAVALADHRSSVAALLAVTAVSLRWGTTSFETITGAAVALGPALRVGPPLAAAALGLAAVALLLSGLGAPLLVRLAAGVAAGAVALGPVGAPRLAPVLVGLVAIVVGAGLAASLPRWAPDPPDRLRIVAPVLAGVALVLAAIW